MRAGCSRIDSPAHSRPDPTQHSRAFWCGPPPPCSTALPNPRCHWQAARLRAPAARANEAAMSSDCRFVTYHLHHLQRLLTYGDRLDGHTCHLLNREHDGELAWKKYQPTQEIPKRTRLCMRAGFEGRFTPPRRDTTCPARAVHHLTRSAGSSATSRSNHRSRSASFNNRSCDERGSCQAAGRVRLARAQCKGSGQHGWDSMSVGLLPRPMCTAGGPAPA